MTSQEIVEKVKVLNLPIGSYIVFGSCPLAAVNLREAGDIDILVSDAVLGQLRKAGWKEINKGPSDKPLAYDVFEAHNKWNFSSYQPTLEHLLSTAIFVDEIPFASLEEVKKWKKSSGRAKDLSDIKLIDAYLAKR
jgi:hypothetical protein